MDYLKPTAMRPCAHQDGAPALEEKSLCGRLLPCVELDLLDS